MWEFIKENVFLVGALTGSVAAYILGLIVNYIRRERKVLGYSVVSRKIVEGGHKDIEIHYKSQPIQRLYSHQVTISNVGNRALKDLPIRVKFDDVFLDPELSQPEGADFKMTVEKNQEIIVYCDMFERNEKFKVGFTSIDLIEKYTKENIKRLMSEKPTITVIARAENLECKDLDASAYPTEPSELVATVAYELIKSIVKIR